MPSKSKMMTLAAVTQNLYAKKFLKTNQVEEPDATSFLNLKTNQVVEPDATSFLQAGGFTSDFEIAYNNFMEWNDPTVTVEEFLIRWQLGATTGEFQTMCDRFARIRRGCNREITRKEFVGFHLGPDVGESNRQAFRRLYETAYDLIKFELTRLNLELDYYNVFGKYCKVGPDVVEDARNSNGNQQRLWAGNGATGKPTPKTTAPKAAGKPMPNNPAPKAKGKPTPNNPAPKAKGKPTPNNPAPKADAAGRAQLNATDESELKPITIRVATMVGVDIYNGPVEVESVAALKEFIESISDPAIPASAQTLTSEDKVFGDDQLRSLPNGSHIELLLIIRETSAVLSTDTESARRELFDLLADAQKEEFITKRLMTDLVRKLHPDKDNFGKFFGADVTHKELFETAGREMLVLFGKRTDSGNCKLTHEVREILKKLGREVLSESQIKTAQQALLNSLVQRSPLDPTTATLCSYLSNKQMQDVYDRARTMIRIQSSTRVSDAMRGDREEASARLRRINIRRVGMAAP